MDYTNNPILTLIQQAMGLGNRAGTALGNAMMGNSAPEAGAGRGFVNPPIPTQSTKRRPQAAPALSPLEAVTVAPQSPVASVMAGDPVGPDMTPDNIDAGGGQNLAMQAPVSDAVVSPVVQRSFIDRLMDNSRTGVSPVEYIFRGLGAAGSPDPMKVMAQYAQQDNEREKLRTESELARKPKVVPLANGAFSLVINADGSTQVVKNDEVGQFLKDTSEGKFDREIMKLLIGKKADVEAANAKNDAKNAGDARQALSTTQALYDGWSKALEVVTEQAKDAPTMSKIQGAFPGISGFFGGDQVATNKFLQGLKVDETLLNTARTKGAISEKEMELFASPIPALSDDREKVWKPYIEQRLPVIQKLMEFQKAEAARGEGGADRVTGGLAKPQGSNSGGAKAFTVPGLSEGASKYFNK